MAGLLAEFGDHLIVGLTGHSLDPVERRLLEELRPLGIILFAKNFDRHSPDWRLKLDRLFRECKDACENEQLLLSVDHEGGRVFRFPDDVTRFPAARQWKSDARDVGAAMGAELAALGFNLSFAPVLDVHSEPCNPVIGERAFSQSVDEASDWAESFRAGLESAGIISCGKHFPGHGATTQDSHKELPRLEVSLETMEQRELVPFTRAIAADIPMIMTAHVVYPALDQANPATLSRVIVDELLRRRLGFSKVVITDDLEMRALDLYTPEQKALMALTAGNDVLLEANPAEEPALKIAERMARALADEHGRGRDFSPSRNRIAALKQLSRQ